ncbi:MAG: hypothetical protein QM666_06245 [Acinetobacter sp.]
MLIKIAVVILIVLSIVVLILLIRQSKRLLNDTVQQGTAQPKRQRLRQVHPEIQRQIEQRKKQQSPED